MDNMVEAGKANWHYIDCYRRIRWLTTDAERAKAAAEYTASEVKAAVAATLEQAAKVAENGFDLHARSYSKDWNDAYETACNYIAQAIRALGEQSNAG